MTNLNRLLLGLCLAALTLGCGGGAGAPYVNQGIADDYQAFYDQGPTQPKAAMEALDRAQRSDPENAYTLYLKASAHAQAGDLQKALDLLKQGNQLQKTLIYVTAPPPEDAMPTLSRVRQLGFTSSRAGDLGDKAQEYLRAVRHMGRRVALAEPVSSLGVLNGAGIVRKTYESEIEYWTKAKDLAKADAVKEALATFVAWYKDLSRNLADTLKDLIREAAKEAGLTEKEMELYSRGGDLGDAGKQQRADAARRKMYEAEVAVLRSELAKMPPVE